MELEHASAVYNYVDLIRNGEGFSCRHVCEDCREMRAISASGSVQTIEVIIRLQGAFAMFIFRTTFTEEDVQRLEQRLAVYRVPSPPVSARTEQIIDAVEFSSEDVQNAATAAANALARE
ncbi:hypothetical protein [Massilia aquatica]|uniref:Uncharacterized protein n=1 Tax=Massilia aquatica TaxID=2609000 RepID=A0ABX0M7G9_9BURK|nr:hypothetical protein [Massilia aquatica]NHZ42219.1 hypothetical protein [Massilia aquatica]